MTLAIFDLDNTLIAGDSDQLWGEWLCERGLVDSAQHAARNNQFYRDYQEGRLDIAAYLAFALAPLRGKRIDEVATWHRDFMRDKIEPLFLPAAQALVAEHRKRGDTLLVVTATNEIVTRPIAEALGIANLIACKVETDGDVYTGRTLGTPSYREGKVRRLEAWLNDTDETLAGAAFYSDSHNDLPLLMRVDKPVAVDPDDTLRQHAEAVGWPIVSLRV